MENLPSDHFVKAGQFVKTTYRDVYPAIDPSSASNSQAGKVIVVTGANRGLGRRAFVHSFAKSGPKGIVIVARSVASLEPVIREIQAINKDIQVLAVEADMKNTESVATLWGKVKDTFGHADVLINNAGALYEGSFTDAPSDQWWNDFEVNVRGTFLNTQAFLKLLGKEKKGSIINLSTAAAYMIVPNLSSYNLSKLIETQIQAYVAAECPNVTAVAMHPGMVLTDMTMDMFKQFAKDTPELVGGLGVWLSTEKASFLSGKYVESNWSVDDLTARKDEIVSQGKLSTVLKGEFGSQQFKEA